MFSEMKLAFWAVFNITKKLIWNQIPARLYFQFPNYQLGDPRLQQLSFLTTTTENINISHFQEHPDPNAKLGDLWTVKSDLSSQGPNALWFLNSAY